MKTLRLGIVGCGFIRPQHMAGLFEEAPDMEVTAACDLDHARLAAFCERYRGVRACASTDELMASGIDAISIAVKPEQAKVQLAIQALERGLHVLAEKPMALTVAEADAMAAAARRSGRVLQIGFNRRFEPVYRRAAELVRDTERFGAITSINASFLTPGGCPYVAFMAQLPHTFDLLHYMAGTVHTIRSVTRRVFDPVAFADAQTKLWHPSEVAYNNTEPGLVSIAVSSALTFASGAVGTLQFTTDAPAGRLGGDRHEIVGSRRRGIIIESMDRLVVLAPDGTEEAFTSNSWCRKVSSFGLQYRHFADTIRGARPTVITVDDARHSVYLYEAFLRSLHTTEAVAVEAPV